MLQVLGVVWLWPGERVLASGQPPPVPRSLVHGLVERAAQQQGLTSKVDTGGGATTAWLESAGNGATTYASEGSEAEPCGKSKWVGGTAP